jgi:oxygen-independent coproporphyrinogen-3 oxidase
MTSLRTQWGIDLAKIGLDFGSDYKKYLLAFADEHIAKNLLAFADEKLTLTTKGKLFADRIAADLFITDDGF